MPSMNYGETVPRFDAEEAADFRSNFLRPVLAGIQPKWLSGNVDQNGTRAAFGDQITCQTEP